MRKAVVICPGRGSYTKTELGYLGRHHADKRELLEELRQTLSVENKPVSRTLLSKMREMFG